MAAISVTKTDLISWVEKSLENEHLRDYEITITGKSEKGDGFLGDIVFLKVDGTTNDNIKKEIGLVVKHGKTNKQFREVTPVKMAFLKEIHLYDKVFPSFKKFQQEKNVRQPFSSVPKCYKTLTLDNMEVLVLDNLKKSGYELHDKMEPMNSNHLKAILREYGKLHALSFAMKDQNKEEFNYLIDVSNNILKDFLQNEGFRKLFQSGTEEMLDLLKERGDLRLFNKFKEFLVKDIFDMLLDVMEDEEGQFVITHGDCWNNNFMFKYENEDRTCPSKVALLDWQISGFQSPALDLSYFLYTNTSKEDLNNFDELMKVYYASFSSFLRELGSNPDELFSYSDLKKHWSKYSLFGLAFTPTVLRIVLRNKEETRAFDDLQEGENVETMLVDIVNKDFYYERTRGAVWHYFEYGF